VRVLIADDQEFIRRGLRAVLSEADIEVCGEAIDGREAILKARDLNPDVVIMDISMPRVDGLEATREMRRLLPHIPVLTLSQYDTAAVRREALNAGAASHVSKTLVWTTLVPALRNVFVSTSGLRTGVFLTPKSFNEALGKEFQERLQQAKCDLQAALAQLELVTEKMRVPLNRCSRDLRYLWSNQPYADWLDRPLGEIVGHRIVDVLGFDAFRALKDNFDRVLAGQKVTFNQEAVFDHIGRRRISAGYSPTFDSSANVDGWVAIVQDVTPGNETHDPLH
jgi:DNA-binding NarL/FixJ family response regulator